MQDEWDGDGRHTNNGSLGKDTIANALIETFQPLFDNAKYSFFAVCTKTGTNENMHG